MNKEEIRKEILGRRAGLPSEESRLKARAIKVRLFNREEFRRAGMIHFYVSFNHEVDTAEMIHSALEMGKRVVVPYVNDRTRSIGLSELKDFKQDLKPNLYGFREPYGPYIRPVDPQQVQLMVIPGVAFDLSGNRLGYGKGFYDRFLSRFRSGILAGLAYDFQIVESIPSQDHDIKMDEVITEYRTIEIRQKETVTKA